MARLRSVCVYCGSRLGNNSAYREAAHRLGTLLGERGVRLIFGGGGIGLMEIVATSALDAGGEAVGVIPKHLHTIEVGHQEIGDLRIVNNMHDRKQLMFELSDAFISLPGGLGTLDETFEIITWRQLGYHNKPIAIIDVAGYWQPMLALIDGIVDGGFAHPQARELFRVFSNVDETLEALEALEAVPELSNTGPARIL